MLYHHHHYFPPLVGSLNTFPIAIVLPSSRSVNLPSCGLSAKLSMHTLPPTTLILTWQMNERTNERTNERVRESVSQGGRAQRAHPTPKSGVIVFSSSSSLGRNGMGERSEQLGRNEE